MVMQVGYAQNDWRSACLLDDSGGLQMLQGVKYVLTLAGVIVQLQAAQPCTPFIVAGVLGAGPLTR